MSNDRFNINFKSNELNLSKKNNFRLMFSKNIVTESSSISIKSIKNQSLIPQQTTAQLLPFPNKNLCKVIVRIEWDQFELFFFH